MFKLNPFAAPRVDLIVGVYTPAYFEQRPEMETDRLRQRFISEWDVGRRLTIPADSRRLKKKITRIE